MPFLSCPFGDSVANRKVLYTSQEEQGGGIAAFTMRCRERTSGRLLRWLTDVSIPGGLIVLAACLLTWRPLLIPEILVPLLRALPAVFFLASLLLAWFFHRSRMTFAVLLIGISYTVWRGVSDGQAYARTNDRDILSLLGILLPINLAALLVIKERGVFTPKGRWLWGAIIVQVSVVFLVIRSRSTLFQGGVGKTWIDTGLTPWTALPQAAVVAFSTAIGFVLLRLTVTRRPIEQRFLWTLVAVFLAFHAHSLRDALLYFTAVALILGVALIQTSYAMAYHDELTGLAGRRAFNETLLRLGSDYVIAMIDVDHFKRFNDTYGHDVGDQVLRMVASHIALVSGGAQGFRYGGEEFAVVFPGKSMSDAVPHLDALRATIEGARFTLRSRRRPRKKPTAGKTVGLPRKDVSVTVSIGAAVPSDRHVDPSHVVMAADRALYRAKKAGRNQLKH
jgi:diguanylate cyclase (GGDEF)-like protein